MTPTQHPVTGRTLQFTLADEIATVRGQLGTTTRTARTLVKNGPLRLTLIGIAPGGQLAAHHADGPITVQVLEGAIEFDVEGTRRALPAGAMLALEAGLEHAVHAPAGGIFLLTVAAPSAGG
jgi:quercetin dioxygenase-like cupin family protein